MLGGRNDCRDTRQCEGKVRLLRAAGAVAHAAVGKKREAVLGERKAQPMSPARSWQQSYRAMELYRHPC